MEPITRLQYNRMICDLLIAAVERFPDWRFGQILRNLELIKEVRDDEDGLILGWQDDFNTESSAMLERAGKYRDVLKSMGAEIDNNSLRAARRLKVDKAARKREREEKKA